MDSRTVKTPPSTPTLSRRDALTAGLAAGASLAFAREALKNSEVTTRPTSQPAPHEPARFHPWWLDAHQPLSRVIDVRGPQQFNAADLGEMFRDGLRALTQTASEKAAWRSILGDAKSIAIKFNAVGAPVIATTDLMARTIIESLTSAGYDPEQLALVELPQRLVKEFGGRRPLTGWGSKVAVGDDHEELARWLLKADAVINVPFLKTHQIAGMSGCLKNISHAVIRRPARWHANHCAPYVGEVVGSPAVSRKLKLHVMNALRVVVRNGPDAREEDVVTLGALLFGIDPVAVDVVALEALGVERMRLQLQGLLNVPALISAGRMGVGRWRPSELSRTVLTLGQ